MALSDQRISRQNQWWTSEGWEATDPHLRRLRERPVQLPTPLADRLDLSVPAIHTVRGPRQVGKSTDLKLLVKRALVDGHSPRDVIYLALDLLEDQPISEIAATIERAKTLATGSTPTLLLLDEVTAVRNWQMAIKSLWDDGVIDRDTVVCTGSSAVDLARGATERLPGRRRSGLDHLVLPQGFAAFTQALNPNIPGSPAFSVEDLLSDAGRPVLRQIQAFGPDLNRALERYLRFGGLPAAVAEAVAGEPEPLPTTKNILWDALLKEVRRKGASAPALEALLERVARSLGSKTNWSRLAEEMDIPLGSRRRGTDYRSVRDYLEFLADGYFILITYFWKRGSDSNAISRDKKVYFGDPLLHTIAHDHAPGLATDTPALVENAIALALYRRYEPTGRQIESFSFPNDLHAWGSDEGGEIDFVCGPKTATDAIEVKYRNRIDRRAATGMRRAFPGRPAVIATKNSFELHNDYALIPASQLLWAIGT